MNLLQKNIDWGEKYLLPSEFGHTYLNEVLGSVTGEEPSGENWWVKDELFDKGEDYEENL